MITVDEQGELQKICEEEWGVTGTTRIDDHRTHGVMIYFDHGVARVHLSDDEAGDVATALLNATDQRREANS